MKLALRLAVILEDLRLTSLKLQGFVDNDSLRLALQRGSSSRMGHLRKTASLNFRLLKQIGMVPEHVSGLLNFADFLTKVLGRDRLRSLLGPFFGIETEQNEHGTWTVKKRKKGMVVFCRHLVGCVAAVKNIHLTKVTDVFRGHYVAEKLTLADFAVGGRIATFFTGCGCGDKPVGGLDTTGDSFEDELAALLASLAREE